jgi:hypothetical protein
MNPMNPKFEEAASSPLSIETTDTLAENPSSNQWIGEMVSRKKLLKVQ